MASTRIHDINDLAIWRTELRDRGTALPSNFTTLSNPALANGVAIACLTRPGAVHGVDRKTGEHLWKLKLDRHGASHADVGDGLVFISSTHTLHAIRPESGEVVWTFSPPGTSAAWLCGGTCVAGDRLFIGDEQGFVYCLHSETGGLIWQRRASGTSNPPVITRGIAVAGAYITAASSRESFALDVLSGQEIWRRSLDYPVITNLQMYRDDLVVPTTRSLYLIDPATGRIHADYCWKGLDLGGVYTTGDVLYFLALRQWESVAPETDEKPPSEGALIGLEQRQQLFDSTYGATVLRLRGDAQGDLLYDCASTDVDILDAKTGEVLHRITSAEESLLPGLVSVRDDIIYLLNGNEVALYALRHP